MQRTGGGGEWGVGREGFGEGEWGPIGDESIKAPRNLKKRIERKDLINQTPKFIVVTIIE